MATTLTARSSHLRKDEAKVVFRKRSRDLSEYLFGEDERMNGRPVLLHGQEVADWTVRQLKDAYRIPGQVLGDLHDAVEDKGEIIQVAHPLPNCPPPERYLVDYFDCRAEYEADRFDRHRVRACKGIDLITRRSWESYKAYSDRIAIIDRSYRALAGIQLMVLIAKTSDRISNDNPDENLNNVITKIEEMYDKAMQDEQGRPIDPYSPEGQRKLLNLFRDTDTLLLTSPVGATERTEMLARTYLGTIQLYDTRGRLIPHRGAFVDSYIERYAVRKHANAIDDDEYFIDMFERVILNENYDRRKDVYEYDQVRQALHELSWRAQQVIDSAEGGALSHYLPHTRSRLAFRRIFCSSHDAVHTKDQLTFRRLAADCGKADPATCQMYHPAQTEDQFFAQFAPTAFPDMRPELSAIKKGGLTFGDRDPTDEGLLEKIPVRGEDQSYRDWSRASMEIIYGEKPLRGTGLTQLQHLEDVTNTFLPLLVNDSHDVGSVMAMWHDSVDRIPEWKKILFEKGRTGRDHLLITRVLERIARGTGESFDDYIRRLLEDGWAMDNPEPEPVLAGLLKLSERYNKLAESAALPNEQLVKNVYQILDELGGRDRDYLSAVLSRENQQILCNFYWRSGLIVAPYKSHGKTFTAYGPDGNFAYNEEYISEAVSRLHRAQLISHAKTNVRRVIVGVEERCHYARPINGELKIERFVNFHNLYPWTDQFYRLCYDVRRLQMGGGIADLGLDLRTRTLRGRGKLIVAAFGHTGTLNQEKRMLVSHANRIGPFANQGIGEPPWIPVRELVPMEELNGWFESSKR